MRGADSITTFVCCLEINLLEPSGPVQACNGIALPFVFISRIYEIFESDIVSSVLKVYYFEAVLFLMYIAVHILRNNWYLKVSHEVVVEVTRVEETSLMRTVCSRNM